MGKKRRKKISPANLEIMKVVWDKGEVTIAEVMEAINAARPDPLRRTTIQVQMNRLEEYGWLRHRQEGRTYHYTAAAGEQKTRKDILKDIRDRVFGGSRAELVRCLLEDGLVTQEEIRSLRQLIDETEGEDQ
jgi:BlaI family penicillinase repressor